MRNASPTAISRRLHHLAIDAAIGVAEASASASAGIARSRMPVIGIDVGRRAAHDALDDLQPRCRADRDLLPEQIELVPGRPAGRHRHCRESAADRPARRPRSRRAATEARLMIDTTFARDVGEAVARARAAPSAARATRRRRSAAKNARSPRGPPACAGRRARPRGRPIRWRACGSRRRSGCAACASRSLRISIRKRCLGEIARAPPGRSRTGRSRSRRAGRPGRVCAGGQLRARQRLGRQPLHRIAVDGVDFRHSAAIAALLTLPARRCQQAGAKFAAKPLPPQAAGSHIIGRDRLSGSAKLDILPALIYIRAGGQPIDDVLHAPPGRWDRPREVGHGFREIHRPRPRFRSVRAIAGPARGPSAIRPRASAQGPARRPGRARGRADRPLRRPLARGAAGRRGGARQAPEGVGRRRRPGLSRRRRWRASSTGRRRSPRRPATASSPSSGCCSRSRSRRTARPARSWRAPASRRRTSTPPSRRCARAAPPTPPRPRTPMTRSRNMPATSRRRRATARSIR